MKFSSIITNISRFFRKATVSPVQYEMEQITSDDEEKFQLYVSERVQTIDDAKEVIRILEMGIASNDDFIKIFGNESLATREMIKETSIAQYTAGKGHVNDNAQKDFGSAIQKTASDMISEISELEKGMIDIFQDSSIVYQNRITFLQGKFGILPSYSVPNMNPPIPD